MEEERVREKEMEGYIVKAGGCCVAGLDLLVRMMVWEVVEQTET
jgi:hypothetical protein